MTDAAKVLTTVRRASSLFRATPGRQGSVVVLDEAEEVMVVGDLHGNVPAFRQVLEVSALTKNPGRHLVLQELVHGPRMYPNDGGDKSHQLIDLVCALKCACPERVHLILGNHELSELTGRPIGKNGVPLNGLFRQGVETAFGAAADEVISAYHELFASLPLAVRTPNRVLLCHTIPEARELDRIDLAILNVTNWAVDHEMKRGGAVYAITWGRDDSAETIDRFASLVSADLFITGHQPCDDGFRQANHRQLIVDGTDPYPTYCLFPAKTPVTIDTLMQGVKVLPMPVS